MAKMIDVNGALLAPENKLTNPKPASNEMGRIKTAPKALPNVAPT